MTPLPLLIDVAPQQLPPEYRKLTDASQPLLRPERFVPSDYEKPFSLIMIAMVAVLAAGYATYHLFAVSYYGNFGWPTYVGGGLLLIGLLSIMYWIMRRLIMDQINRRQGQTGKYRRGLFVTDHAILLNLRNGCTLIPKHNIVKFGLSYKEGQRLPVGGYVHFKNEHNHEFKRPLVHPSIKVSATLTGWMRRGQFKWIVAKTLHTKT